MVTLAKRKLIHQFQRQLCRSLTISCFIDYELSDDYSVLLRVTHVLNISGGFRRTNICSSNCVPHMWKINTIKQTFKSSNHSSEIQTHRRCVVVHRTPATDSCSLLGAPLATSLPSSQGSEDSSLHESQQCHRSALELCWPHY
jgi:hypothetical protein